MEEDDIPTFASRIKQKYPQYADMDDTDLVNRVVQKYPVYASQVQMGKKPIASSQTTQSEQYYDVTPLVERMRSAIGHQESGNTYSGKLNERTSATGRYQILPANIPRWTKKYYGRALTPQQFHKNAEAQDAVFTGEMEKYLRKAKAYGVDDDTAIRMGAAAWYGGEGNMHHYDANWGGKGNEPSFRDYTSNVLQKTKGGSALPTVNNPAPQFNPIQDIQWQQAPEQKLHPIDTSSYLNDPNTIAQLTVSDETGLTPADIAQKRQMDIANVGQIAADAGTEIAKLPHEMPHFDGEMAQPDSAVAMGQPVQNTALTPEAEADTANRQMAAERQQKVARLQSSVKPKPVAQNGEYEFQREGKLIVPSDTFGNPARVYTYDKNLQDGLQKGEFRFTDEDGDTFIFSPDAEVQWVDEADTKVVEEIDVPLAPANSMSVDAARRTQAEVIADTLSAKYPSLDRQTVLEYFDQYGMADWNTKEQLSAERFFQPQGFTDPITGMSANPTTDKFHVTQRDINRIETYAKAKAKAQADLEAQLAPLKQAERDDPYSESNITAMVNYALSNPLQFSQFGWVGLGQDDSLSDDARDRLVDQTIAERVKNAGGVDRLIGNQAKYAALSTGDWAKKLVSDFTSAFMRVPGSVAKTAAWAEDTLDYINKHIMPISLTTKDLLEASDWVLNATAGVKTPRREAGDLPKLYATVLDKLFPDDPVTQNTMAGKLVRGSASMIPMMLAAMATGGGAGYVALVGAAMQAGEGWDEAKKDGLSRERALVSGGANALLGATEAAGLKFGKLGELLMKKSGGIFVKSFLNWLSEAGKEMTEESLQEFFQSAAGEAVKTALRTNHLSRQDIARAIGKSTNDAAVGGILGALFGGGVPLIAEATNPNVGKVGADALPAIKAEGGFDDLFPAKKQPYLDPTGQPVTTQRTSNGVLVTTPDGRTVKVSNDAFKKFTRILLNGEGKPISIGGAVDPSVEAVTDGESDTEVTTEQPSIGSEKHLSLIEQVRAALAEQGLEATTDATTKGTKTVVADTSVKKKGRRSKKTETTTVEDTDIVSPTEVPTDVPTKRQPKTVAEKKAAAKSAREEVVDVPATKPKTARKPKTALEKKIAAIVQKPVVEQITDTTSDEATLDIPTPKPSAKSAPIVGKPKTATEVKAASRNNIQSTISTGENLTKGDRVYRDVVYGGETIRRKGKVEQTKGGSLRVIEDQTEASHPLQGWVKQGDKPVYGSKNTIVSPEEAAEIEGRLRKTIQNSSSTPGSILGSLGDVNVKDAVKYAAYHIEAGARTFAEFSQRMVKGLGDKIRPHLKSLWNQGQQYVKKLRQNTTNSGKIGDYGRQNTQSTGRQQAETSGLQNTGGVRGSLRVVDEPSRTNTGTERQSLNERQRPVRGVPNKTAGTVHYGKPVDDSIDVHAVHFSRESRPNLDSSKYGTGSKGGEAVRLRNASDPDIRNRIHFYYDKGEGIHPETGIGVHEHHVLLRNMYDADADPKGIIKAHWGDPNAWESGLIRAGYDGYATNNFGKQGAAVLLGKHIVPLYASQETPTGYAQAKLEGLPSLVEVDGIRKEFGSFDLAQNAARAYVESQGREYKPPTKYAPIDKEFATRVANAYEEMVHDPSDPKVQRAYQALVKETIDQWKEIKKTGLKVDFIEGGNDPYGNPRNAILDVVNNNHLWVFPTDDGFGSNESFDSADNPLLATVEGETINGKPVVVNDIFRIVHDYFGHIKDGNGFRASGEENAYRSHAAMYSPEARKAMASETRGQSSWVNFGPHAEQNRNASGADTIYADQKVGLLPDWAIDNPTETNIDKNEDKYQQDIIKTAQALSKRFNVPMNVISQAEASTMLQQKLGDSFTSDDLPAGFYDARNGKAYLVEGKITPTTPIHEIFTHPFIESSKVNHPELYRNLIDQAANTPSVKQYVEKHYGKPDLQMPVATMFNATMLNTESGTIADTTSNDDSGTDIYFAVSDKGKRLGLKSAYDEVLWNNLGFKQEVNGDVKKLDEAAKRRFNKMVLEVNNGEHIIQELTDGFIEAERVAAVNQGRFDAADTASRMLNGDIALRDQALQELQNNHKAILTTWIDYLNNNNDYSNSFKVYVLNELFNRVQIGTSVKKRTATTASGYLPLFPGALAQTYHTDTTDFWNIYPSLAQNEAIKAQSALDQAKTSTDGKWITFKQGISDGTALSGLVQNTPWCTKDCGTAAGQLREGDFHVFVTKDSDGNFTQARIAIRMSNDNVAEVRGIADQSQNIEPEMTAEAEAKYKDLPGGEKYKKIRAALDRVTSIEDAVKNNDPISRDDFEFIIGMQGKIPSFGYGDDPRIKILKDELLTRQRVSQIFDVPEQFIVVNGADVTTETVICIGDIRIAEGSGYNAPKLQIILGDAVFESLTDARGLNNLTTIGGRAYFKSLTDARGLNNLTTIGYDAFFNSLTDATGLTNLTTIRGNAYFDSLTDATGLTNLTKIGYGANFESLTDATGLTNLTTIGGSANFKSLTDATGLTNLTKIGYGANFESLTDATGLTNLTTIEGNAYFDSLTDATGLKNLTTIGYTAFFKSLTDATGLTNLTTIRGHAYFDSLTDATGLTNLTTIRGNAYFDSLTDATGLKNLTTIGYDAFFNSLTDATGLKNLTTIGYTAYFDSLTDATGLKNLTTIGYTAHFKSLTDATGLTNLTKIGYNAFFNSLSSAQKQRIPALVSKQVAHPIMQQRTTLSPILKNNLPLDVYEAELIARAIDEYAEGKIQDKGLISTIEQLWNKFRDKIANFFTGAKKIASFKPTTTIKELGDFVLDGERQIDLKKQTAKEPQITTSTTSGVSRTYGAKNKIITSEKVEKARKILSQKLGQANFFAGAPLDPVVLKAAGELAAFHIEAGSRKSAEFTKRMIADAGEAIRPYLEKLYNKVKKQYNYPGMDKAYINDDDDMPQQPSKSITKPGVSKVGKSIENKAIEQGLTKGFPETAGYDPKDVKGQIARVQKLIDADITSVREMVLGMKDIPDDVSPMMLLIGLEEVARVNDDVDLMYELANSHVVKETSIHAQELRMARERTQDSATTAMNAIRKQREADVKRILKGRTIEQAIKEEAQELAKTFKSAMNRGRKASGKRQVWSEFISSLQC